jgi:hypothetical protein
VSEAGELDEQRNFRILKMVLGKPCAIGIHFEAPRLRVRPGKLLVTLIIQLNTSSSRKVMVRPSAFIGMSSLSPFV